MITTTAPDVFVVCCAMAATLALVIYAMTLRAAVLPRIILSTTPS